MTSGTESLGRRQTTSAPERLSATEVVDRYLEAFYTADFETARRVVAEDFSFRGPFLQVEGKTAFFDGAEGLRHIVKGHRIVQQWSDGPEVSSLYEVNLETPDGSGVVLMSEWHTVHDSTIVAGRVVFDTAAFRALMPSSAS